MLPALERLADPPPAYRRADAGSQSPEWDVHERADGAQHTDQLNTGGPGVSHDLVPAAVDPREQSWEAFSDDCAGPPGDFHTPDMVRTVDSPDAGVRQDVSTKRGESDSNYGWPSAHSDDAWEVRSPVAAVAVTPPEAADIATGPPHHQDLLPIVSPAQQPVQLLSHGRVWSGDYRLRPWYRTRRAAAAFAGAAAAIVAAGILLVAHTPSDRDQQPTIVVPQVSTTQPTPHTTAHTSMSTPAATSGSSSAATAPGATAAGRAGADVAELSRRDRQRPQTMNPRGSM